RRVTHLDAPARTGHERGIPLLPRGDSAQDPARQSALDRLLVSRRDALSLSPRWRPYWRDADHLRGPPGGSVQGGFARSSAVDDRDPARRLAGVFGVGCLNGLLYRTPCCERARNTSNLIPIPRMSIHRARKLDRSLPQQHFEVGNRYIGRVDAVTF